MERYGYGLGFGIAGLVLAAVQTIHGTAQTDRALVFAFEAGPFVLVALTLAYVGYWVADNEAYEPDLPRILAWGAGSTLLFASVAALMLFGQRVTMGTLRRSAVVAMDLVTVGAVVGVVVGLYDARGQQRRRTLERQRDRIEDFANKAADVNNYGRAFHESSSVDEVSALCVQGMGALLGISQAAIVAVDDDGVRPIDSTIVDLSGPDLAGLVSETSGHDRATVVRHDDPPEQFPETAESALSILLAEPAEGAIVAIAAVPEGATFDDEDIQLTELLASHAGTALDDIAGRADHVESARGE